MAIEPSNERNRVDFKRLVDACVKIYARDRGLDIVDYQWSARDEKTIGVTMSIRSTEGDKIHESQRRRE